MLAPLHLRAQVYGKPDDTGEAGWTCMCRAAYGLVRYSVQGSHPEDDAEMKSGHAADACDRQVFTRHFWVAVGESRATQELQGRKGHMRTPDPGGA